MKAGLLASNLKQDWVVEKIFKRHFGYSFLKKVEFFSKNFILFNKTKDKL